jgi:ATP-dependent Clp protease ATP-binding subunit ClpA
MSDLSPAASLVWKIAAAEAGEGRHEHLEKAHLLMGILSLEKFAGRPEEETLEAAVRESVRAEQLRIADLLSRAGARAAAMRRALRATLGVSSYDHAGRPISRSDDCKAAFRRAAEMATSGEVTTLHLLAAVLEDPDPVVGLALDATGVAPESLASVALSFIDHAPAEPAADGAEALVSSLAEPTLDESATTALRRLLGELDEELRRQHGVTLSVDPEAERLIVRGGSGAQGSAGLQRSVEQLVRRPLESLISTGKIRRYAAWRAAYDEGGIYIIPAG